MPRFVDLAVDADVHVDGANQLDFLTYDTGLVAADLDGDGFDDFVVATPLGDGPDELRRDAGEVHVVFGPLGPGFALDLALAGGHLVVFGAGPGENLGRALAAGDVDGDGVTDLVMGAPAARGPDGRRFAAGAVRVLLGPLGSGTWDLATTPADLTVHGAAAGDQLGDALAVADLDGDGKDDVVAAAPGLDGPDGTRLNAGAAVVVLGRIPGVPSTIDLALEEPDVTVHGEVAFDSLGSAVAVGDLSGDGVADLVVSTMNSSGQANVRPQAGEVHVVFGPLSTGVLDLAASPADVTVYGADAGDLAGYAVAVAAVSGGAAADLIVTAPYGAGAGNGRPRAGEVHVLFGPLAHGLRWDLALAAADFELDGARPGDALGWAVTAGDLNGDGVADLVATAIGGDGPDGSRFSAGSAHGVAGPLAAGGLLDVATDELAVTVVGATFGDQVGSAAAAGDLSGDGVADLLLGARFARSGGGTRSAAGKAFAVYGEAGGCSGAPVLVGVPADATVACGEVPPPPAVSVDDPCDPGTLVEYSEEELPGACGGERVLLRTWTADSACGGLVAATQLIVMIDLVPPVVTAGDGVLADLWPPNHRLVRFTTADFGPEVADVCGGATTWRLAGCASSEPADGAGDGSTDPDCVVAPDGSWIDVRAERSGTMLAPRRYAVAVVAEDECGNVSAPTVIGHVRVGPDSEDYARAAPALRRR